MRRGAAPPTCSRGRSWHARGLRACSSSTPRRWRGRRGDGAAAQPGARPQAAGHPAAGGPACRFPPHAVRRCNNRHTRVSETQGSHRGAGYRRVPCRVPCRVSARQKAEIGQNETHRPVSCAAGDETCAISSFLRRSAKRLLRKSSVPAACRPAWRYARIFFFYLLLVIKFRKASEPAHRERIRTIFGPS